MITFHGSAHSIEDSVIQPSGYEFAESVQDLQGKLLTAVQVGEGRSSYEPCEFLLSDGVIEHIGLESKLSIDLLDLHLVLSYHHVSEGPMCLRGGGGEEGHTGERRVFAVPFHKRPEPSIGRGLVGLLGGIELHDCSVLILETEGSDSLSSVHIERPERHSPEPTQTCKEVGHGFRLVEVAHDVSPLQIKLLGCPGSLGRLNLCMRGLLHYGNLRRLSAMEDVPEDRDCDEDHDRHLREEGPSAASRLPRAEERSVLEIFADALVLATHLRRVAPGGACMLGPI